MAWIDRLHGLTDQGTIGRGRAYAESGLVTQLLEQAGRISATVKGTDVYRVELTADTWFCDCPVGATGAFCKHCVAVVIEASGPGDQRAERVDLSPFEAATAAFTADDDPTGLADEVTRVFKPRRRSYDYTAANGYASAVEPMVRLLEERASRPASAVFLSVIQTAIGYALRAILSSDDSSGLQSMQLQRLLDAHERAAADANLTDAEVKKLVKWLYAFMFDGKQDFLVVDIDRYAGALGSAGIDQYRQLVEKADEDEHSRPVEHALGRLAILSRDPELIVEHFGAGQYAYRFITLVMALDEAGHAQLATDYARQGVAADPRSYQLAPLVQRLVDDAQQRGAVDEVVSIRHHDFHNRPSTTTYAALERAAKAAGTWDVERVAADEVLSKTDPRGWVQMLHRQGDHQATWKAAESMPDRVDVELWTKLLSQRTRSDPASALPHYRRLVQDTLIHADRRNYQVASRLLRGMRDAADAAGRSLEFDDFLAEIREQNRRRPTFGEELWRAGL